MLEYAIFYKKELPSTSIATSLNKYDVFISAFNKSERISSVFDVVPAAEKIWVIHPEYLFQPVDYPKVGTIVAPSNSQELSQVNAIAAALPKIPGTKPSICLDSTGFMRATLCLLLAKLEALGYRTIDVIYSEPTFYTSQEQTSFAITSTGIARVIQGMGGSHNPNEPEHLILGVGYDHKLVNEVVKEKDGASVVPLFSFPSLSADMYQQSVLRSSEAGEVTKSSDWLLKRKFAPANDPFAVASVLQEIIAAIDAGKSVKPNIYLSPLATKAQAVGFSLYFLMEGKSRGAVSMILPESRTYSHETSKGLKRLWLYTLEF